MENQTMKLNKGDNAPEFRLVEADGEPFSLSEKLKEGSSIQCLLSSFESWPPDQQTSSFLDDEPNRSDGCRLPCLTLWTMFATVPTP